MLAIYMQGATHYLLSMLTGIMTFRSKVEGHNVASVWQSKRGDGNMTSLNMNEAEDQ